jgi:Uma2 family endonuclease
MAELKLGRHTLDVPYTLRLYDVTDEMFDELADADTRAELIDGVMIVHSPVSLRHDDIAGFLRTLMRFYAAEKDLGCVFGPASLVRLSEGRRVGPSVYFLARGRVPRPLPEEYEGVPELVLEVLSPANRRETLKAKRPVYRAAGVREIWFVDPEEEQILVDRRRGRRYVTKTITAGRVRSAVLAGFWLEANWLWSDPPPSTMQCLRTLLP